jgi:hypothetical protein
MTSLPWRISYLGEVDMNHTDHSGREVSGMNCLRPLKHWDRRVESHLRHGCLCAFILCLCILYVDRGLVTG